VSCLYLLLGSTIVWAPVLYTHRLSFVVLSVAATDEDETATVEDDIGKSRDASRTDDEVVDRFDNLDSLHCSVTLQS